MRNFTIVLDRENQPFNILACELAYGFGISVAEAEHKIALVIEALGPDRARAELNAFVYHQ